MLSERSPVLRAPAAASRPAPLALDRTGAWLGWLFVCVVWGTTYYAIKAGVRQWDPLLFTACRFAFGGAMLLAVAAACGWLTGLGRRELMLNAAAGLLLFVTGNGALVWASTTPAASGTLALQVAMIPVYTAVFAGCVAREERLKPLAWAALLVGLAGVAWMTSAGAHVAGAAAGAAAIEPRVAVVLQLGCASWAIGSLVSARASGTPPACAAGIQMFAAGAVMLTAAAFTGRVARLPAPTATAMGWLVYLTVVGSVLGFFCFTLALRTLPVTVVALHAHINPVVAVLVGVLVGERWEALQLGAGLLILASAAVAARHTDRRPA